MNQYATHQTLIICKQVHLIHLFQFPTDSPKFKSDFQFNSIQNLYKPANKHCVGMHGEKTKIIKYMNGQRKNGKSPSPSICCPPKMCNVILHSSNPMYLFSPMSGATAIPLLPHCCKCSDQKEVVESYLSFCNEMNASHLFCLGSPPGLKQHSTV